MILFRACLCVLLCLGIPALAAASFKPFVVSQEVSIRTGDWFPLPTEDMKAAAVDTALAEITKGGLFSFQEKNDNRLRLEISLIGPAETAKLTIHVNIAGVPSYVSTASISVHDMDYQGIYNAFEHIGRVAAQRLNDKTRALEEIRRQRTKEAQTKVRKPPQKAPEKVITRVPVVEKTPEPAPLVFPGRHLDSAHLPESPKVSSPERFDIIPEVNNENLREIYDMAQTLKRQYQYHKARVLFEQIVAVAGPEHGDISTLAKDELRYGLTVFEARQAMVSMSSGDLAQAAAAIQHAENLYRQILAENRDSLVRTQEAQMALDNLSVTRNALKGAVYAQSMITASHLRVLLTQEVSMSGECPDEAGVMHMTSALPSKVSLRRLHKAGAESRYDFIEQRSGNPFTLVCDGIQFRVVRQFSGRP